MRERHVPGGLNIAEADIEQARDSIGVVMRIVCDALGFSVGRSQLLEGLVHGDYERYLQLTLLKAIRQETAARAPGARRRAQKAATPAVATVKGLVDAAYIGHTAFYNMLREVTAELESCALAVALLLEARGDFVHRTAWHVTELASPVGKEASGPGIVGGRQRLLALTLAGGDMSLPCCLRAPAQDLDERRLTAEIRDMLEPVQGMAAKLREYAYEPDQRLHEFDLDAGRLAAHQAASTLLVSELHIGAPRPHGESLAPLYPNAAALWEMVQPLGITQQVVESTADPHADLDAWDGVAPEVLGQLLSFACQMGLNTAVRASEVTYLVRRDGLIFHRHQHLDGAGALNAHDIRGGRGPHRGAGEEAVAMASSMSLDVAGFGLDDPARRRLGSAEAIGFCEFMATNASLLGCPLRFGERHAPASIQAPNARPLLGAVRMISNALLVAAVRRRQAGELQLVRRPLQVRRAGGDAAGV